MITNGKETKEKSLNYEEELKKLIQIEIEKKDYVKITINYVKYLEKNLMMYQRGKEDMKKEFEKQCHTQNKKK